jgi:hypothetical protein
VTEILTLFFATRAGIRTSARSTAPFGTASILSGTLPYHPPEGGSAASVSGLSPGTFLVQLHSTSPRLGVV